jgi:menaquinone-dependent protoporphyrinogen oxidase
MARILVLFSSYDGQTRRIAERIALGFTGAGHRATCCSIHESEGPARIDRYDAVVVGSAIRFGKHASALDRRLRGNAAALSSRPNAFFSVCLSIAGPRPRPDLVEKANAGFFARAGWIPARVESFSGALPYRRYHPLVRLVMRFIVGQAGGDTDTSRDYEYTDWGAVDRFAADFAKRLASSDGALRAAA